jgi:CheY-like chemotaxis protein
LHLPVALRVLVVVMSKRVLSIGNCYLDQTELQRLIAGQFQAEIVSVARWDEAQAALHEGRFDLVLVNRRLYGDTLDGVDVIARLKADPDFAMLPVMLLSNHAEYQKTAVDAGAEPGFGKAELDRRETREKLRRYLASGKAAEGNPQGRTQRNS